MELVHLLMQRIHVSQAKAWYVGANFRDKPRGLAPLITGGFAKYRKYCAAAKQGDYRSFAITSAAGAAPSNAKPTEQRQVVLPKVIQRRAGPRVSCQLFLMDECLAKLEHDGVSARAFIQAGEAGLKERRQRAGVCVHVRQCPSCE